MTTLMVIKTEKPPENTAVKPARLRSNPWQPSPHTDLLDLHENLADQSLTRTVKDWLLVALFATLSGGLFACLRWAL